MCGDMSLLVSKWPLVAVILTAAYAAPADLNAQGFDGEIMRKEQDGVLTPQATEQAAMFIGSQGRMIHKHHTGLHSSPVKAHAAQKSKLCDSQCTLTVKISSTIASNAKTMRLKGCKDESFHFDGCADGVDAATICSNSEHAPTGVHVLKNSHNVIVGYGSCCIAGHTDTVVETTLAEGSCKPSGSDLLSNGKTVVTNKQLPAATAVQDPDGSANVSASGMVAAWPQNATSIEQGLALLPSKFQFVPMMICGTAIGVCAIISSIVLMYSHLKAGAMITGCIHKLHSSSAAFIGLVWAVPVFTLLGLLGILLPELAAAWQFLQALVLTATLRGMPAIFLKVGGGRLQMQRNEMANRDDAQPLHVFSQWPFGCLYCFVPSKVPEIQDVDDLQLAVTIACAVLPCLSFLEMFCSLEATLPASVTHPSIAAMAPAVATFTRMMEVVFIALVMSALRGLEVLVQALSPKASEEMHLRRKSAYCQFFLGGLRLFPILYHLFQCTWCDGALQDSRRADAARSICICGASLVCTWMAWRAFPVDAHHYPELKAATVLEGTPIKRMSMALKPVLDTVQFCPFCGSGDLELESDPPSTTSASCPRCCARQVPVNLIVHRDRTSAAPASSSPEVCRAEVQEIMQEKKQ